MDATARTETLRSIGLLILRVGIGVLLMTHGWGKVQMILNGQYEQFGDPIGMGKQLSLILAAGAEFVCAGLVVIGLGTRFAAAPAAFTMAVAAFIVHQNDPWYSSGPGASKEPALKFMFAFLALIFTGAGRFSLDHLIMSRRKSIRVE